LKILRRIFPFATRRIGGQKRVTLHYHLGLDPGLEEGKTSLTDYRANLRKLMRVIEGKRAAVVRELEKDMKAAAKAQDFEAAAHVRNQLFALQNLHKQIVFSDKEFMDISKDHALNELVNLLSLPGFPRRIEGYDISHMQGTNVVASMVVFTNGVSDKAQYRKFKMSRQQNDDFFNMHETIARRLSEKHLKDWGKPDLVLIDGGKGQLDAAIRARDEQGQDTIPFVGLAKREEQIVTKKPITTRKLSLGGLSSQSSQRGKTHSMAQPRGESLGSSNVELNEPELHRLGGYMAQSDEFILVNVPHSTNLVKLLQRIRDESHRFAVSYHSVLKVKGQTASLLDDIPTIGPVTRKKLIKTFGSMRGVLQARDFELAKVVGEKKAAILKQYLRPLKREQRSAPSARKM
ncbi:MAG TPA: UvrB/UvrC motif-containing protein, partial [Candidatus Saccharimonadales bacterium]